MAQQDQQVIQARKAQLDQRVQQAQTELTV
jgi:hypothetical protein